MIFFPSLLSSSGDLCVGAVLKTGLNLNMADEVTKLKSCLPISFRAPSPVRIPPGLITILLFVSGDQPLSRKVTVCCQF